MARVAYEDVAEHLEADGSLRDIYVYDTTPQDWQHVWDALVGHYVRLFDEQREPCSLPPQLNEEVLASQSLVTVTLRELRFNGYFRGGGTIEFDIEPKEVRDQRSLEVVLDFMQLIADATSKAVTLTEEMGYGKRNPIIKYTPADDGWSHRN